MTVDTIYVVPVRQKRNYSGYSYFTEYELYGNDVQVAKTGSWRTNLRKLRKKYPNAKVIKTGTQTRNY